MLSSGSDPYEFHSQCLGAEPQEIGRRGTGGQGELEHTVDRDLDRNTTVSESGSFENETQRLAGLQWGHDINIRQPANRALARSVHYRLP